MTTISEVLSGVLRYFPNTMTISLLLLGAMLGKISWVLIATGGIALTILILTAQYAFGRAGFGEMPGAAVIQACSLLPVNDGIYSTLPSLWVALTTYYLAYILTNAGNIYSAAPPKNISKNSIAVAQRKSVGVISIVSVSLLFLFFLVPRYMTNCETVFGLISGLVIGAGMGVGWWYFLDACNSEVYPDIHGVMIGLKPGALHTSPMVCS